MTDGERFSLKDHLFNPDKVAMLAGWLAAADPAFPVGRFQEEVNAHLGDLELKARISWIADVLDRCLPASFEAAAEVMRRALPPPLDPARTDDDFGDFILAPFGEVVERRGLETAPRESLDLLEEITQRFSMEFTLRAFINRWPDLVLARLEDWAAHPNYHVRRLVSEGTRPRLPWAQAVTIDPRRPLPLLDRLHADPTRYVTRSVANHLNDLSRIDPALVIDRLERWRAEGRQSSGELDWMARQALRSQVKAGDPAAMRALGLEPCAVLDHVDLVLDPAALRIGEMLVLTVTLRAPRAERVLVDYAIDFVKARGRRTEKVFRMKETVLPAGREVLIRKQHRLKRAASTYTLFPGTHVLHLQINGRRLASRPFELLPA